ncbi:MAG: CRTAC1 family protein [Ignavibacteriales bacterium]|nr:CRTAC1 family protein [Ignavibacteriales bacterium]
MNINKTIFIQIIVCLISITTDSYCQLQITDISLNLLGDANNSGKYGGHGIMFGDADGDNDPDLYITMNNSSPMADQYFENNGSGVFTEKAAERGIDNYDLKGSHGWVWADLDNDGDYDGWNGSYSKNIPYRNKNDQPGFFDNMFTTSGIDDIELGTRGVAAFDFDNDGDLDLFGNNWYARSTFEDNEFYRNDGNFTFTRIDNGLTKAKGDQGVCDGDFDNDGDIDLLLSVFEGNVDGRCVKLMENVDGQFIENLNTGIDLCNASFHGVTFWDMNNDGWLDVVSANRIFINNKDKTFSEVTGLPALSSTSFMLGIADLNNDGYWDLVPPGLSPVYINNGDLTFTPISYNTGTINDPRCVSFADIDGDGDIDFALGQKATYNRLYRNDYDGLNKSLFVKLKSADNQIGAFGSKVFIYSENGDTLLNFREAHSNQGYLSQDDPTLHFGCGNRNMVLIKIVFLNGSTFNKIVNTNQTLEITPFLIEVNVFLEGSYKNNNVESLDISLLHPFNQNPWNYNGNELTTNEFKVNNKVIDWLLLELKNNSNQVTIRKAVLLKNNGQIINTYGSKKIDFWNIPTGNYNLIIYHRNHLPVMSSETINFP